MNERQFQQELEAEAPHSVPDSLRERVEAIPTPSDAPAGGGAKSTPSTAAPPVLGLSQVVRQRRTLAMLLGAALLAGASVGVGAFIRQVVP